MTQALHQFGLGADEYLFALDAEEGVSLRSEAPTVGAPFLHYRNERDRVQRTVRC